MGPPGPWQGLGRAMLLPKPKPKPHVGACPRGDLNTHSREISRIRGNHEVSIAGKIPCPPRIGVLRMAPDLVPSAGHEPATW